MGDDEIGVVNVNVQAQASEEEACEAADHKQANEAERINHGRVPRDRAFVEGRSPIKNVYRRGNRHQVAEERKSEGGGGGLTGTKPVVRPDQGAANTDGDARAGAQGLSDEAVRR